MNRGRHVSRFVHSFRSAPSPMHSLFAVVFHMLRNYGHLKIFPDGGAPQGSSQRSRHTSAPSTCFEQLEPIVAILKRTE